MPLPPEQPKSTSVLSTSQNSPGSGSFVEKLPSADWTNDIIALTALLFAVITFIVQQRQNRLASAEQREKDRQNNLDVERLRQQTIRLEWYRDIVRDKLDLVYLTFDELHKQKSAIRSPELSEEEKDRLSKAYKDALAILRTNFLERILFIHGPTYDALKTELDDLAGEIVIAIFNDDLKLSREGVYEREIGNKIKDYQQRFFKTLYTYRGEE